MVFWTFWTRTEAGQRKVGKGTFDADFAATYWRRVLGEEGLSALGPRSNSECKPEP